MEGVRDYKEEDRGQTKRGWRERKNRGNRIEEKRNGGWRVCWRAAGAMNGGQASEGPLLSGQCVFVWLL